MSGSLAELGPYLALVLVCVALLIVGTFRLRNPARV